jgi:hypothetical protein
MPIVSGNMYPELKLQMLDSSEFNVLILGELTADHLFFLSKLDVLHNYIGDRIGDGTKINVHALKSDKRNMYEALESVSVHQLEAINAKSIAELIQSTDADVILDTEQLISDKDVIDNDEKYLVVRDLDATEVECETFLVGRNIAWIFKDPMWNTTLFTRYYMRAGLCRDTFYFMGEAADKNGYTQDQVERVRFLTNKIGQIDYCKDIINSYLQKKRRAYRHGNTDQDFNFELNYHLSNYYFLISGGLDIIARVLNDVFSLGITHFGGLGLEKDDLTKALEKDHPDIAKLYGVKKVKEWIEWLKERRNYVAHEGGVHHTQLVEEKAVKMTPEELERKIDEQTDWPLMKTMLTPEQYQAQRDMVANIVRMDDYDEVAADVMLVKTRGNTKVFMPLRNIDHDYKHFQDITRETIEKLRAQP